MRLRRACAGWVLACAAAAGGAQQGAGDPLQVLTSEQHLQMNRAMRAYGAGRFGEALPLLKTLLPQLEAETPAQVLVAKVAAEAAINVGERLYAVQTLTPIEAHRPDDWQAAALLARAYAEGDQEEKRDAEVARLRGMEARHVAGIERMPQFLLEKIPLRSGTMEMWLSLAPWGPYNTWLLGRVLDGTGRLSKRLALESDDADQMQLAHSRPELAAKGVRRFSLDGYAERVERSGGQVQETHTTYGFYDGEPAYETVRDRMVAIAEGRGVPLSRRTSPVDEQPPQQ